MEVIFHFIKKFKIDFDSTRVDKALLESKFHSFCLYHYLPGWVGCCAAHMQCCAAHMPCCAAHMQYCAAHIQVKLRIKLTYSSWSWSLG
jgi:hypothetical protein